jgi:hypothetical protein
MHGYAWISDRIWILRNLINSHPIYILSISYPIGALIVGIPRTNEKASFLPAELHNVSERSRQRKTATKPPGFGSQNRRTWTYFIINSKGCSLVIINSEGGSLVIMEHKHGRLVIKNNGKYLTYTPKLSKYLAYTP